MIPAFDNHISKGAKTFIARNYLPMTLDVVKKVVNPICAFILIFSFQFLLGPDVMEGHRGEAAMLAEIIIINCHGSIDHAIEPLIDMAVEKLKPASPGSPAFQVLVLNIIINAIYYNPKLSLQILEKKGYTIGVFKSWFNLLQKQEFKR